MRQGIEVPARNFTPRYGTRFQTVFGDAPRRWIARGDVVAAFALGDEIGCLTTIAWGFPRGGRPGGRSLEPAVAAIPHFAHLLPIIRRDGLDATTYAAMNELPEVKNGVTTKVLYFAGATTGTGAPALIYDARVHTHLLARRWDEFEPLTESLRATVRAPKPAQYLAYLETVQRVASQINWEPAAVEMFMFRDAPGWRPPRHGT